MGKRVHVLKKCPEYGSEGFNWKQQEFKDLLDCLGCCTSGDDYADEFDCNLKNYENALSIIKLYKESGECDLLKKMLSDAECCESVDSIKERIESLGDIDEVISTMEDFYNSRDKSTDYIMFSCW